VYNRAMDWSRQRPTKYGLYWFRGVISSRGVDHVKLSDAKLVRFSEPRPATPVENSHGVITLERRSPLEALVTDAIEHWEGEWAGPLQPPRDK
jgi:hypothetical protein